MEQCSFSDGSTAARPLLSVSKLLQLFKVSLDDGGTSVFPFSVAYIAEKRTMGVYVVLFLMDLYSLLSGTELKHVFTTKTLAYFCINVSCPFRIQFEINNTRTVCQLTLLRSHGESCAQRMEQKPSLLNIQKVPSAMKTVLVLRVALDMHDGRYTDNMCFNIKKHIRELRVFRIPGRGLEFVSQAIN